MGMLGEEERKKLLRIISTIYSITDSAAEKRLEKITETPEEIKLEHCLYYLEKAPCSVLMLFNDHKDPICINPIDSKGSVILLVEENWQVKICLSCFDLKTYQDAMNQKKQNAGKGPKTEEEKAAEKKLEEFTKFLKLELEVFERNRVQCFYFGSPAKVTLDQNVYTFDYGEDSGYEDWKVKMPELVKQMKELSEGFAVNEYKPSENIPRHNAEQILEVIKAHETEYMTGTKNKMWHRTEEEGKEEGDESKEEGEGSSKKRADNKNIVTEDQLLMDNKDIILVNTEMYLTIILCFATCIQRFYQTVKIDYKSLTFEDLSWTSKNPFGGEFERQWNHIGMVYLASLKISREAGDIYQFPMFPRRNGLSNAGSSVTMANCESSFLYFTEDDKRMEVLMKLLKLYCQGNSPEKGVYLLNQYILSKWSVNFHVMNRTHVSKDLFSLVEVV